MNPPNKQHSREKFSNFKLSVGNIRQAFLLVWRAHPASALGMGGCSLFGALLPTGQAWVSKLIVDTIVKAIDLQVGASAGLQSVMPYLLIEFVLILIQAANNQARTFAEHILHARINLKINTQIIEKALELDLAHFENAEYYDKLQNARREADWRSLQIVNQGFYLIQNTITLISFGILLVGFSPWLVIVLVAAVIPAFIVQNHFAELNFRVLSWRTPESRKLQYLEYLLTNDAAVKEVKLFGLGKPLLGQYADLFWKFLREDQALAGKRSFASLGWGLLSTMTYYGTYAWIVWRTAGRMISLGDMTMYIGIVRSSQGLFQSVFYGLSQLYENGLFMSNLFAYLELAPNIAIPSQPISVPTSIQHGIEFRNVFFKYEGSDDWVLNNINLTIHPGEKIALVGLNGAGKTTLIKLLTRLYDPTEGEILLDGVDITHVNPDELHAKIGVIFQDFVHYHLSARENIGFGQVNAMADERRIIHAAEKSGAHPIIEAMPQGYDFILGRWFTHGRELSGGEWQKIALGRAFMRECEILVLDEPTAALDAENELRVFQQFRELAEEKMAVLISHRFSTVRMADKIYVIEGGMITEQGTHAELLALQGTYARLFTIQAESYR